jgi:hypothetical protein
MLFHDSQVMDAPPSKDIWLAQSHFNSFLVPIYHYWKIHGSLDELNYIDWVLKGTPSKYLAPPDEIEVMCDNYDDYQSFRESLISHLHKAYVEDWDLDDELVDEE